MIQKLAKQRQDSIDSYRQGGREDLVEKVKGKRGARCKGQGATEKRRQDGQGREG